MTDSTSSQQQDTAHPLPKGHAKKQQPTVKEFQEQVAKLTDLAARAQADLQNFKMRMEREAGDLRKFALAPLAMKLLPVRNDLARAASAHPGDPGYRQVLEKLDKVLGEAGVNRMDALGNLFDPTKHEVLNTVPGEKDRVLAVFEEGYELQGRILRPAKVQVGDGSPTEGASEAGTESLCPSEGAE